MLKRPGQHVTETASKKIFEALLPNEWVAKQLGPDYGTDYLVEVFKNNTSTGNTFFVQLKGSETQHKRDVFALSIEVSHLLYWQSLTSPVLLVVINTRNAKTYGIWANSILDNYRVKKGQKSISLTFTAKHSIDKEFFQFLGETFSKELATKTNITGICDSSFSETVHVKILQWLEFLYQDKIVVNHPNLPSNIQITYQFKEKSNRLLISLKHNNETAKTLEVITVKVNDPFFNKPIFSAREWDNRLDELLFVVSILMAKKKIESSLFILERVIGTYNGSFLKLEELVSLFLIALQNNRLPELQRIFGETVKAKQFGKSQLMLLLYMSYSEIEIVRALYRENLKFLLDVVEESDFKARCCYNMANALRAELYTSPEIKRESAVYYFRAYHFDKTYIKREYWWRELAGILFGLQHYKIAELFYAKSMQVNNRKDALTPLLIADCQFFQGQFVEAMEGLKANIDWKDDRNDEWILKLTISNFLIGNKIGEQKLDRTKSDLLVNEALSTKIPNQAIDILLEAVRANPINGLAWYNLAIYFEKVRNYEEAFYAFLTAALFQDWDKEAWFKAMLHAMNFRNSLFAVILKSIYFKFTKEFVNDFAEYIMTSDINLDNQGKRALINILADGVKTLEDALAARDDAKKNES